MGTIDFERLIEARPRDQSYLLWAPYASPGRKASGGLPAYLPVCLVGTLESKPTGGQTVAGRQGAATNRSVSKRGTVGRIKNSQETQRFTRRTIRLAKTTG